MPVTGTNIATIVRRHTTAVNHDSEYNKANTSNDLDRGQNKLHFPITENTKNLDATEEDEEYSDPDTDVDVCSPVFDRDRSSCELEGQNRQPADGVVPAYGEAPGRINETNDVGVKGTVDGEEDRQFT